MKISSNIRSSGVRVARIALEICLALAVLSLEPRYIRAAPATMSPRIFFSDLLSGPATGGEDGHGVFITLYGAGFGPARNGSYITIGGAAAAASYPVWNDNRISFQLLRSAKSGPIVVHTGNDAQSNGVLFTVRPGRIFYFPAKESPRSLIDAVGKLKPGDTLYLRDGVTESALDRYDAVLNVMSSGRAQEPISLLAYPGAIVTIGSAHAPHIAVRTPNVQRTSDHWVIGGLHIIGYQEALDVTASSDWRVVGNDFTCPFGFGPTGCIEFSQASGIAFLGNTIHDVAQPHTGKTYHALYFSTDSNHIDVGWNRISNVRGCRAIQFHSTPLDRASGRNQFDLHVHDNIIHNVVCDGINFATVDPSLGKVEAYNNLFYDVGQGPDPPDGSSNYSCIYVQGGANSGAPGSGTVEIYNNTMYRCGGRRNTDSGAIALSEGSPHQSVRLRNNLIVLSPDVPLISPNSIVSPLQAESNLVWWLDGKARRLVGSGFIFADPHLQDPAKGDFTLQPGSTAIDAGVPLALTWNLAGEARADSNLNIGAY